MFPIRHVFTTERIESLVCTAVELWACAGDSHDILSTHQKTLLARAHELLTDDDPDDNASSGVSETAFVVAHHDPGPFALDEPAFERCLAVHTPTGSRACSRAATTPSPPAT